MILSRIVDKHLKSLALKHVDTKFIKLDAEVSVQVLFYSWCRLSSALLWLITVDYNLEYLIICCKLT